MASPELAHAHPASPFSADVTEQSFDVEVLTRSAQVPVLVDFWAAWCGPCQMLMPVLAKLAQDYQGGFFLAKVNTDVEQRLAGAHGIRSLPTVKLFHHGKAVGEFMGVQPERAIRALLDRYVARPSDARIDEARQARERGDAQAALALLQQGISEDPANDRLKLAAADALLALGRVDDAEAMLKSLAPAARAESEAATLAARVGLSRLAGATDKAALTERVARDPGDLETRLALAARHALAGDYPVAMDELLEIIRRDRKFKDDAARKTLLTVFNLLGGKGDLVTEYRKRLALLLQ